MENMGQENFQQLTHFPPSFDGCEMPGGHRRRAAGHGPGRAPSPSSHWSHVSTMLSHRLWRGMDLSRSRPRIRGDPTGRRRRWTVALATHDGCAIEECDDRSLSSAVGRQNKRRRTVISSLGFVAAAACILLGALCPVSVRSFVAPSTFQDCAMAKRSTGGMLSMSAVMEPPPLTRVDVGSTSTQRRRDARFVHTEAVVAGAATGASAAVRVVEPARSTSRPLAGRAAAVSEASVRVARKAAAIAAASSARAKRAGSASPSTVAMARPIVLERTFEDNAQRRAAAPAAPPASVPKAGEGTTTTRRRPISSKPRVLRRRRSQHASSTMPGFSDGKAGKSKSSSSGVGKRKNAERMYRNGAGVPDSMSAFVAEIHRDTKLLTASQEVELGTKIQEAIRIQDILDGLRAELGREPTDEEWTSASGMRSFEELEGAVEAGGVAKKELVLANLRMVQRVVNLYLRNGLGSQYNAGDLMQEGTMALIRAAEKFEPDRGFRFSTYAMYWIRASVKRSQVLQSSPINVPQRLYETYKKVQRTSAELRELQGGRRPTSSELARASGLSEVQLHRCTRAMEQRCYSLDAELNNRSGKPGEAQSRSHTMYDLVEAREDDREAFRVERLFVRDDLIESMRRHLSPERVDLLLLRFGLMDERTLPHGFSGPLTISEVSRLVGIKPDKVRRLINNSLRQLKSLIAHEWEP